MEKILFVDDDPEIQDIVKTILKKAGYEVISARDGEEALNLAKVNDPDLIILDYVMPRLNGVDVLRALKKDAQTQLIPVIMVTAYSGEKVEGLSAGAMDFITKPIDKTELLLRIRLALKVRHITNELQRIIAYIGELGKIEEPPQNLR